MNKEIINLLYRFFDDELSLNEKQKLEAALASSQELREQREQILEIRKTITGMEKHSFQPLFVEGVMRNIYNITKKPKEIESLFNTLLSAFRPLAFASSLVILITIGINMFSSEEISIQSAFAVSDVEATVEDAYVPTLTLTLE